MALPRPAPPNGALAELIPRTLDCVHCGLCLPVCPTYRETGREVSSPRGRVLLMRGVAEGEIALGPLLAEEAYLCLGCRACETACPSGVRFGVLLERARAEIERAGLRRGWADRIEKLALRSLIPYPRRLHLAAELLRLAQRSRLLRLARWFPEPLRRRAELLPPIVSRRERCPPPARLRGDPPRRGRVGLWLGCVARELFASVNAATARVLQRNGFDVVVLGEPGCCGALHAHAGQPEAARTLVEHLAQAVARSGVEVLVTNSAGCGAHLREAGEFDTGAGAELAGAVRDVCEWLEQAGLRPPPGRVELRVCYDDPCHLLHAQRIAAAPRRLLQAIPGLDLLAHADAGACCGAAGTYALTHPGMSAAVLERKLDALAAAAPDAVATGNPGCLLQLAAGARRRGLRFHVVHPVELLDQAYGGEDGVGPAAS